jgi:hypothetical protein
MTSSLDDRAARAPGVFDPRGARCRNVSQGISSTLRGKLVQAIDVRIRYEDAVNCAPGESDSANARAGLYGYPEELN